MTQEYHVKYFYHATGMENGPDIEDFGTVSANSEADACDIIALKQYPEDVMYGPDMKWSTRSFFRNCLTAEPVSRS